MHMLHVQQVRVGFLCSHSMPQHRGPFNPGCERSASCRKGMLRLVCVLLLGTLLVHHMLSGLLLALARVLVVFWVALPWWVSRT
jgi:hypothetical protein